MIVYRSGRETQAFDPGVAKFGIALEWGSRGLEFESRHSDQKAGEALASPAFLFEFHIELEASCITITRPKQSAHSAVLLRVRISTLGPKMGNPLLRVSHFLFQMRDSNDSCNADKRCRRRLDGGEQ